MDICKTTRTFPRPWRAQRAANATRAKAAWLRPSVTKTGNFAVGERENGGVGGWVVEGGCKGEDTA